MKKDRKKQVQEFFQWTCQKKKMEEKKNTTSLLFATTASSSNLHAENNMIKSEKKI